MKTALKTLSLSLLLSASMTANAGWTVSGGYGSFNQDIDTTDVTLAAVYASVGYAYESGDVTFMPELRAGVGVEDDMLYGVNVELDNLVVASVRAQYNINDSFGVFIQPSYGRLESTARLGGQSVSDDAWETGLGGGALFSVGANTSIEAVYESFDGTDVLSVGFRYSF